tara:strand:+ start:1051 stop:2490 length:1440 start_codon:yes stop_codon:yes gene_type:complete
MPIITTYPFKKAPLDKKDEIVLSDALSSDPNFKTKTTDLDQLMNYVQSSITTIEPISLGTGNSIQLTGISGFGTAGQVIAVNQAEDALEYINGGGGGVSLQKNTVDTVDPANTINYQNGVKVEQDLVTATTANINIVYESTLTGDPATVEKVGGFEPNTLLSSINENTNSLMWDTLLFPTVPPNYSLSTRSLSPTSFSNKEVGSTVNVSLTYSAIKNDAGAYTRLQVSRGGNELASVSNPSGTTFNGGVMQAFDPQFNLASPNRNNLSYSENYSDSFVMPAPTGNNITSSVSYTSKGDYSAGFAKKNSKGVDDNRTPGTTANQPQAARTNYASPTRTVTGFYPYFFGYSSTQQTASDVATAISNFDPNNNPLNLTRVLSSGSIPGSGGSAGVQMPMLESAVYRFFAFYEKVPLKIGWYVHNLNAGTIGQSGDQINAPITIAVDSVDSLWSNINYKIYVSPLAFGIAQATPVPGVLQIRQ